MIHVEIQGQGRMTQTTIKMIIKSNNNIISYDNQDRDINITIAIIITIIELILRTKL